MAKALEDTAFYRYVRLASLNDVGGDPARFGVSPTAFHEANRRRLRATPFSLLSTATHHHKRGEGARAGAPHGDGTLLGVCERLVQREIGRVRGNRVERESAKRGREGQASGSPPAPENAREPCHGRDPWAGRRFGWDRGPLRWKHRDRLPAWGPGIAPKRDSQPATDAGGRSMRGRLADENAAPAVSATRRGASGMETGMGSGAGVGFSRFWEMRRPWSRSS